MKKLFTLFAAALVGVSAFAFTEGNTKAEFKVARNQDAAQTQIDINILNSNEDLNTIQLGILPENGAQFVKMGTGLKKYYVDYNGAYVLANLMPGEATDEDREAYLADYAACQSNVKDGMLVILTNFITADVQTFPATDGTLGFFMMDLTAVPDGESVTIARVDSQYKNSNFGDTSAKGYPAFEEDVLINVTKADGIVSAINVVETSKNVASVKYFNLQGIESATPFDGVNIMVRTYEDGSKDSVKFVK